MLIGAQEKKKEKVQSREKSVGRLEHPGLADSTQSGCGPGGKPTTRIVVVVDGVHKLLCEVGERGENQERPGESQA